MGRRIRHFVNSNPPDTSLVPISRTQVVDEMLFCFTHTTEIPWMLPGVAPTGRLAEAVRAGAGQRVLDAGCGTGSTTLAAARQLGAEGRCIGIDISEPMIAAARARAEREGAPARFIRADAQTHAFDDGRARRGTAAAEPPRPSGGCAGAGRLR